MHLLTLRPLILCALALAGNTSGQGKVFMKVKDALALAFPGCKVERTSVYLTAEQKKRVAKLSGAPFKRGVVFPYVARKKGKLVGTAYFDVHRVRTLKEALMIVVTPDHEVRRIELLMFGEPLEYIPRKSWYDQLLNRKLSPNLNLKRSIKGVTGATLTARATVEAARTTLALHTVLAKKPARKKKPRTDAKPKPRK